MLFLKSGNSKCHCSVWDSLMSPPGIGQHVLRNNVNEQCFSEDMGKIWLSSIFNFLQKYEVFELSDIVCAFCQRTVSVKFGWCCLMSDNKLWLDRNPHRYCVYTIWMGELSFLRKMHYWEKSIWTLRWWYHSRFYVVHLIAKKLFQVQLSGTWKLLGFQRQNI